MCRRSRTCNSRSWTSHTSQQAPTARPTPAEVRGHLGPDLHPASGLTRRYFPGHGHRAGVPRFVGDEVHRLHNAHTWDEVKKTKQLIAVTVPHAAKCPTPGTSTLGRGRNAPVVGARSPGSAKHCACRPAPGPQEAPGRTPT